MLLARIEAVLNSLFYILAALSVVSSAFMVYARRPIDSALSFLVTLLSIAALFALTGASFLFAIEIIIYAGAILTLILLIIMFLNIKEENLPNEPHKKQWFIATASLLIPFDILLIKLIHSFDFTSTAAKVDNFGDIKPLGKLLYSQWVLPFELISILLLVSLLGAIIIAKPKDNNG